MSSSEVGTIFLGLSGPITAAVWYLANAAMREKSREAVEEQFSKLIQGELAAFKGSLIKELNGTYRRSTECALTMGPVRDRIESADRKLDDLHKYAHSARHDACNKLFGLEARVEVLEKGTE